MKVWLAMSERTAPTLEKSLQELVKIRASQINGCANCLGAPPPPASSARAAGAADGLGFHRATGCKAT